MMTLDEFRQQLQALVDQVAHLPPQDVMVVLDDQVVVKEGEIIGDELRAREEGTSGAGI